MNDAANNDARTWENTARLLLQLEEEGASATIRRLAREKLVEIAKELDVAQAFPITPDVSPYVTPVDDMPAGYDTIIGWLAKNSPELLQQGFSDPRRTISDGNKVRALCRDHDRNWLRVPAPPAFQCDDIKEVNAYPVGIIAKHFGEAV